MLCLMWFSVPLAYRYEGGYNDAEVHFVDYFQRTDGIKYLPKNIITKVYELKIVNTNVILTF